jgi:hypothetical protein
VTDTGDTRSLTYAEIGKARGISAASAKRLALRHGWRKVAGNDGLAGVSVPVTWLETSPETPLAISPVTGEANVTGGMSPVTVPVAWLIEARADAARAKGEVTGLREALQRGDALTEQALGQAERERDRAERERERADAAYRARQAAEAAAEAARAELADWTAGGPLGRAWRALIYRRRQL